MPLARGVLGPGLPGARVQRAENAEFFRLASLLAFFRGGQARGGQPPAKKDSRLAKRKNSAFSGRRKPPCPRRRRTNYARVCSHYENFCSPPRKEGFL